MKRWIISDRFRSRDILSEKKKKHSRKVANSCVEECCIPFISYVERGKGISIRSGKKKSPVGFKKFILLIYKIVLLFFKYLITSAMF